MVVIVAGGGRKVGIIGNAGFMAAVSGLISLTKEGCKEVELYTSTHNDFLNEGVFDHLEEMLLEDIQLDNEKKSRFFMAIIKAKHDEDSHELFETEGGMAITYDLKETNSMHEFLEALAKIENEPQYA